MLAMISIMGGRSTVYLPLFDECILKVVSFYISTPGGRTCCISRWMACPGRRMGGKDDDMVWFWRRVIGIPKGGLCVFLFFRYLIEEDTPV